MRVLWLPGRSSPSARLDERLAALGHDVQRLDASVGSARTVLTAVRRTLRPAVALVHGSMAGALVIFAGLGIPAVVLEPGRTAPRNPLLRLALTPGMRSARAVVIDRWAEGRALAQAYGAVSVTHVWPGLNLADHPPAPRADALAALGFSPAQRFIGLISPLDAQTRIELILKIYRDHPGLGLLVTGRGPRRDALDAMAIAARPSAPVIAVGGRGPATDLMTAAAATVGLDLEHPGPGDGALSFLVQGRRLVTTGGEDTAPLLGLYPPELRAVHVVRPTEEALRAGLGAALQAEAELGPLPEDAVRAARRQLDASRWPERIAAVLEACA